MQCKSQPRLSAPLVSFILRSQPARLLIPLAKISNFTDREGNDAREAPHHSRVERAGLSSATPRGRAEDIKCRSLEPAEA